MLILKDKKAVVLKLKSPERVTTVIPTAKTVKHQGARLVAVPHRPDETRVLRNLGFDVPDPMPIHYDWPKASGRYDPFIAQRETANFLTMHHRAFCLNGMGTGKTNATLWAFDYLRRSKQVQRMLVVELWLSRSVSPIRRRTRGALHALISIYTVYICIYIYIYLYMYM